MRSILILIVLLSPIAVLVVYSYRHSTAGTERNFWIAVAVTVLISLFIPLRTDVYRDGGTRVHTAAVYKAVEWNRIAPDDMPKDENGLYRGTSVYWFPNNLKGLDTLWETERASAALQFLLLLQSERSIW